MKPYLTILLLLLLCVIDATGDAFRYGAPVLSHSLETLQIAGWFGFAGVFALQVIKPYMRTVRDIIRLLLFYALMYTLGRIWLFDITYNLWCSNELLYLGSNDLVGKFVRWFADLVGQNYIHFSFMMKFLALFVWVGLLIKCWRAER